MSDAERAVGEAAVRLVRTMHEQADEAEYDLLTRWRAAGLTWPEIAELYGITEQGMGKRHARLEARVRRAREEAARAAAGGRSGNR